MSAMKWRCAANSVASVIVLAFRGAGQTVCQPSRTVALSSLETNWRPGSPNPWSFFSRVNDFTSPTYNAINCDCS